MADNSGALPAKRVRLEHGHDILVEEVSSHQREVPGCLQGDSAEADYADVQPKTCAEETAIIRKAKKNKEKQHGGESFEIDVIDQKQESNTNKETVGVKKARKEEAKKKRTKREKYGVNAEKMKARKKIRNEGLQNNDSKQIIVIKETENSLHALLECSIVAVYQRYNRLDKLVFDLVAALKEAIKNKNKALLPNEHPIVVEDVIEEKEIPPIELSTEWCSAFQRNIPTLPSSQVHTIFSTLINILDADCVLPLENDPEDTDSLNILSVVSQLLRIFLRGVHIADHTVQASRVAQFVKLMANLHTLLGRLGSALLQKQYDHLLMTSFLGLCLAWGDLHVLLFNYRPIDEMEQWPKLAEPDPMPTNLQGLHSYLMNDQWSLIAQRITNFGEGICKQLLDKLILQKLSAMILFDDEACKDAKTAAAKSLAVSLEEDLLETVGDNGLMLTASLDNKQTLALASRIVERIKGVNAWPESELEKPGVQENRPLILGLLVQTLTGIGQNFVSPKSSKANSFSLLANDVCAYFTPARIEDTDMQSPSTNKTLSEIVTGMTLCINKCLAKDVKPARTVTTKFDLDALDSHLRLLKALPLENLNEDVQNILLSCFLAVIISVETVCSKDEHQATEIKKKLQDLLLSILCGRNAPNICQHVKVGPFLRWMSQVKVQDNETHCRQLLQILFSKTLLDISCLESLEVGVPLLLKDGDKKPEASHPVHLEAAIVLLQAINRHQTEEPKMKYRCHQMQKRLGSYLMNISKSINESESDFDYKHLVVEAFHETLESFVATKDADLFNDIKGEIENVTIIATKTLKEGDRRSLALLTFLMKHSKVFGKVLPENFTSAVWDAVMDIEDVVDLRVKLMKAMSYKQFEKALNDLLAEMESSLNGLIAPGKVEKYSELWTSVVTLKLDDIKTTLRMKSLTKLADILLTATLLGRITDIKPILRFNVDAVNQKDDRVTKVMLNFYLESISVLPLPDMESIHLALKLLTDLLQNFLAMITNVLPAFVQRYSHIVRLVAKADGKHHEDPLLEPCAFGLERLAYMMAGKPLEFSHVAPYIVADILQQFEMYALRPDIKLHFINAIHSLFKIFDENKVLFLAGALTPASKLIFQAEYDNYATHHRFTGKI